MRAEGVISDDRRRMMFDLVRAFGFEPSEVVEGSLEFDGANVKFVTMPGRVPRSFPVSKATGEQVAAIEALTGFRIKR